MSQRSERHVGEESERVNAYDEAEQALFDRFGIDVTSRFVDVPAIGGRAHALVSGDGPPLVLVIGGGPPPGIWAPLMAALDGFTVHVLDLPGMGRTDRVPFTTGDLRPLAVDFLDQTIEGLGLEDAPIVGQSMAGLWSAWLALDRPERVPALVLMSCPALILGTSAPLPMRVAATAPMARLLQRIDTPSPKQVERFIAMAGEDFSALPELRRLFLEFERLPDCGAAFLELIRAAVRLRGARPEVALTRQQLEQVRSPVQMIWGDHDPFGSPEVGKKAARIIPDAEIHVVPGGHAPWVDNAEHTASLIAGFLAAHRASTTHVERR